MKIQKNEVSIKQLIASIALILAFVNPYVEGIEFKEQWVFMVSHYLLFIGGFLLVYKVFRGNPLLLIPSAILVVFWHTPYYFALAGSFLSFRLINDISMIVAGLLAGIGSSSLKLFSWLSLFVLWMTADTAYSIFFLLQVPQYSNVSYPFSPYSPQQEIQTAVAMWFVMSGVIIYVIGKFLKKLIF
ncbi:hypothetical protein CM19_01885 [Candidatus Acidianus copahuensis]|uniref:DUF1404 domain-containing protein n=1 Tax=Candidatus Acidianus copahuensis TaxID=1160895 RepID=A0A031LUT7_9CREN|nr:DUF1404 domain-containing protein [Candidatus Acidianus copahuensis]EZQ11254.1 hypothetical protein CM19_01885 [Candidatus Acidianus copahuensis]